MNLQKWLVTIQLTLYQEKVNTTFLTSQLATLLFRYDRAETPAADQLAGYTDASAVSEYALPALNWAVSRGILNGTSESTLSPQDSANRVQTAALLSRYLKEIEE